MGRGARGGGGRSGNSLVTMLLPLQKKESKNVTSLTKAGMQNVRISHEKVNSCREVLMGYAKAYGPCKISRTWIIRAKGRTPQFPPIPGRLFSGLIKSAKSQYPKKRRDCKTNNVTTYDNIHMKKFPLI
ncbi:hypothetical protein POVWA1_014190 [Plasmodium ovale wallikeri]|uniref:Uncharacterized protein n=1 Tax=Plasmodium ovale wallikeri TaxID=864142 RepID=A0A1A8YMR4_PLAOA|nr:hypothetical protein POVWA1_014190 [Plasmodium ovale wallikeri]